MKPWAGYVRVSSVGGREGDRFRSPSDQEKGIRGKAREVGGPVVMLVPDLDSKGSDPEREVLLEAVEGVEQGRYRGIIVAYLSRLSRRTEHTLEMWRRVKEAGGRVLVVDGNLDSDNETKESKLQLTILAGFAELEHDTKTENFANARRSANERGIYSNRRVPKGYARDPETRRLVPGPEADLVREAFRMARARASLVDLAQHLGMSRHGALGVIRNRVYLGELHDGEFVNLTAHPPLVTEEEWLAAQVKRTPARRKPRAKVHTLLAGLVRCASCGHAMSGGTNTGGTYYQCHRVYAGHVCPAPAAIGAQRLDPYVEDLALAEWRKASVRVKEDPTQLDALRSQVRRAKEELSAYLAAVSAADVGADAFAEGARTRRQELEDAEGALGEALATSPTMPEADLVAAWGKLDLEQRTRALAGLIEVVIVTPLGSTRRVPVAERATVVLAGAGLIDRPQRRGAPHGLLPITVADIDREVVLGV